MSESLSHVYDGDTFTEYGGQIILKLEYTLALNIAFFLFKIFDYLVPIRIF